MTFKNTNEATVWYTKNKRLTFIKDLNRLDLSNNDALCFISDHTPKKKLFKHAKHLEKMLVPKF